MESVQSSAGSYTQQPFYSKIGGIGRATADAFKGISPGTKFRRQNDPNSGEDRFGTTYANFVIGPVNVVNKTNVRDMGLKFENDIKLNFEYELKSLNYVNPKIAMIDTISNMLTMTTNNAQFFGGIAFGTNVFLCCHTDADFMMSIIQVFLKGKSEYLSEDDVVVYFCFPMIGVAVPLRPGDYLLFNARIPHCISSRCKVEEDILVTSIYLKTAVVGMNNNDLPLTEEQTRIVEMFHPKK
jgi:hypothetical protein